MKLYVTTNNELATVTTVADKEYSLNYNNKKLLSVSSVFDLNEFKLIENISE